MVFRYKFDDERVTKEDTKKALEEQYGGEEEVTFFMTNVHSIQYLRTCINFPLISSLYGTVASNKPWFQ